MGVSAEFIYGYVVGEGSFCINKQSNAKTRFGNGLAPRFNINCNRCDLPVLQEIRRHLGVGSIYNETSSSKTVSYAVTSRKHIINIVIPFFEGHLYGGKLESFNKFKMAVAMIDDGVHKTRPGYDLLCNFIDTINPSGKNIRKDWKNQDEQGTLSA